MSSIDYLFNLPRYIVAVWAATGLGMARSNYILFIHITLQSKFKAVSESQKRPQFIPKAPIQDKMGINKVD